MSVILDALKRVQDENRRRGVSAEAPRAPVTSAQGSSSLLRRLSAPPEVHPETPARTVSPAVGMAILAVALTVVLALALWFFQPSLSGPEINRGRPLLSDLSANQARPGTQGAAMRRSPIPAGVTAQPTSITEPFAAVPVAGQNEGGDGTAASTEGFAAVWQRSTDGDMSDLSGQLDATSPSSGEGSVRLESGNSSGNSGAGYLDLTSESRQGAPGAGPRRGATTVNRESGRASVPQQLLDPGIRAAFQQGVRAQKDGDYGTAEQAYKRALKLDPANARVNTNLGVLYEQLGRLALAERHLRQSIAVESDNPNAHNNLGVVLYRLGNYDAAMLEFNRTLALDANRVEAHTNRGLIFTRWGQYREAENSFMRVIEIDPGNALAHYNLGLVYEELDRIALAAEHYYQFLVLGGSEHPRITEYLAAHLEWLEERIGGNGGASR